MKVRNIIRKAAVLGSAATMVGATIMGATAYNLADYPDQYIVDGMFDGKIVVGENAATSDVLGAIDISASLQASSTSETEVDIPGVAGEVSLTGDAFRIETSSDLLEIRETVGDVYDTLTDTELEALEGGTITTDEGSTDYNQYLRFAASATSATEKMQEMAVNYVEDEEDTLGDFLVIDDNMPFFEWEIEFTEGLESAITSGELDDLEDEVFNIFGTDFTFVDSSIDTTDYTDVTLEFMAGDVGDTLREGETKTYTIDGVDYEVTAVFISDPASTGTPEAKFAVNGELTDGLADGDTDTLSNGMQIGVRDLLVNSREGVVEFFLGANKIEFRDTNTSLSTTDSNGEYTGGTVEISNENIEDASIAIVGEALSSNTKYKITSIKYRLKADAIVGSTIYVPPGMGVREFLDEPVGLLSPTFDITYEGLKDVEKSPIDFNARSDHSYDLELTSIRGKTYDFPFITNKDAVYKWGDDDDDFWFTEANPVGDDTNLSRSHDDFPITDDDYFVLSEDPVSSANEKTDSAIFRYDDIETSDQILTFTDMSTGESREVTYADSSNGDEIGIASNFVVDGQTYVVHIGPAPSYALAIDLDGSGNVDGGVAGFTVKGGGVLNFGVGLTSQTLTADNESTTITADQTITMQLATPAKQFDDNVGDMLNWTVYETSTDQITLSVSGSNYTGPHAGSDAWDEFDIINDNDDDDYDRGLTDYGAEIEYYNPTGDNDAEELTIMYPATEVGAQVFVVAGVTERSSSGAGGVTSTVVNPIAVGLAVLDKDAPALGDENLIIVGGPRANSVAFDFLGAPSDEDIDAMFEPGKAMIVAKEYGDTVAILVAGYEAQESLGASYVLADYGTYLAGVEGSEVEVIATDLSDLQVTEPMAEEE